MKWLLRICKKCRKYTLSKLQCPYCGGELAIPHPPRFSPEDRYVYYRYKLKKEVGIL